MPKKRKTKKRKFSKKSVKKARKSTKTVSKDLSVKKEKKSEFTYTAADITVLKGLEPVRKRPGMYIGGTGTEGLHHLIWEVVDNSIDEAMAGFCNEIKVKLQKNNVVTVEDNGRGIPVDIHKVSKKSALETVMTTLYAGGKFGGESYKVSGGLHGVGVSVVNALSDWTKVEVRREGKIYIQEYSRGKTTTKLKVVGKAKNTGTIVSFHPDPKIFRITEFDWKKILDHLRQQAYLMKGLKIIVIDERHIKKGIKDFPMVYCFYFEGGIVSYVKYLNQGQKIIHSNPFYISRELEGILVEASLLYSDELKGFEISFANNIHTIDGGTHIVGFRMALTRTINDYARKNDYLKPKEPNLAGEDIREGLTAVVSVKLKQPQFEGQTKARLGNAEVRGVVNSVISEGFSEYLERNPADARQIMEKCLLAAKARRAAKAAKETVIRKGMMEGLTLPGKLADCSSRNPKDSELYIVEGDSAGGSAKQARDRAFQAILPLRGKILNVEKSRLDKMLASKEIKALVIALGTSLGEDFNIKKLRYHRIIIMTDADVDGAHIRTLLLTLFYRYFEEIIKNNHLYIAQPPLYRIQYGEKVKYVYSEEEKNKFLRSISESKKKVKSKKATKAEKLGFKKKEIKEVREYKVNIQRYKGLGEMNPDQLWDTTMNPENRLMLRVTLEDAEKADQTFDILMGEEVEPRRVFIQTHAKKVKNLDI